VYSVHGHGQNERWVCQDEEKGKRQRQAVVVQALEVDRNIVTISISMFTIRSETMMLIV
jgi:hypothetical protein